MHDRLVGEPMEGREIPIWQTVKTAYRLGFESVLAFPSAAIAVTAALFAIDTYSIPEAVAGVAVPYWIEIAVYHFVRVVVLAPFAILIHRSIVLGDHAATYLDDRVPLSRDSIHRSAAPPRHRGVPAECGPNAHAL